MATQQVQIRQPKKKHYTMLFVLQMFSSALIFSTCFISVMILIAKAYYSVEPYGEVELLAGSPIYAAFGACVCLVLSFLLPEYILESTRRQLKTETDRQQTEDMPFVLIPSIFIRYGLLAMVTIISFVELAVGRGYSIFLPLSAAAVILMIAYFPTEARMRYWITHDHKVHLT